MLVLTRKIQQQIQIGPNITITILQVKGNAVRVGIEAPRDVRIVRRELGNEQTEDATPAVKGAATMPISGAVKPATAQGAKLSLAV